MKIIPLHSLVIDTTGDHHPSLPLSERLRLADIRAEAFGGTRLPNPVMDEPMMELIHRIGFRLDHGRRVVISGWQPTSNERRRFADEAIRRGLPVFYVIDRSQILDRELLRGDGLAELIDQTQGLAPVGCYGTTDLIHEITDRGYQGITVVGDVHGMSQSLHAATTWARARNHFIVFLGDVIDYGIGTLDVADDVHRLICRGEATMVVGNHERKILRWLNAVERGDHGMPLSEGNKVTARALVKLGDEAREQWVGRFRGIMSHSRLIARAGGATFVHAAIHPSYWEEHQQVSEVTSCAMFGEADPSVRPPRFATSYAWIDAIPNGEIVVAGHDVRSSEPRIVTGALGGRAVFLDTGCGKGGRLSTADFRLDENGTLHFQNMSMH